MTSKLLLILDLYTRLTLAAGTSCLRASSGPQPGPSLSDLLRNKITITLNPASLLRHLQIRPALVNRCGGMSAYPWLSKGPFNTNQLSCGPAHTERRSLLASSTEKAVNQIDHRYQLSFSQIMSFLRQRLSRWRVQRGVGRPTESWQLQAISGRIVEYPSPGRNRISLVPKRTGLMPPATHGLLQPRDQMCMITSPMHW